MKYQNWRFSSVTSQAATDAAQGTALLTTGDNARVITLCAAYWGTNTTASINMRYYILPETAITQDANGQYALDDNAWPAGFASADLAGATPNVLNPMVVIGIGAKGQSNQTLMLPPNSIFVAAPSINQNGTIIHKVISAEYAV